MSKIFIVNFKLKSIVRKGTHPLRKKSSDEGVTNKTSFTVKVRRKIETSTRVRGFKPKKKLM